MIAVYPGTFDPVTFGHMDIINRAVGLVDKLYIGVLDNKDKKTMFTTDERIEQLNSIFGGEKKIEIRAFNGLQIEFARECGCKCIIRGLRNDQDFNFEFNIAVNNKMMDDEIENLFLVTNQKYLNISSSMTKEIARFGGKIDSMVTEEIMKAIINKVDNKG